jgi:uncharacterized protein YebE (UPF0316 family)
MDASSLPIWGLALLIFVLRVGDVTLGTVRTLSVVQGRVRLSVFLGFFEILIWVTAISQVVTNLSESPLLAVAYAGGFAAGNATGILLERRLAMGSVVVRLISARASDPIAAFLDERRHPVAVFDGRGKGEAPVRLVYTTCRRKELREVLDRARALDADVIYAVEPLLEGSLPFRQPLPHATGWRAVFLRK